MLLSLLLNTRLSPVFTVGSSASQPFTTERASIVSPCLMVSSFWESDSFFASASRLTPVAVTVFSLPHISLKVT